MVNLWKKGGSAVDSGGQRHSNRKSWEIYIDTAMMTSLSEYFGLEEKQEPINHWRSWIIQRATRRSRYFLSDDIRIENVPDRLCRP